MTEKQEKIAKRGAGKIDAPNIFQCFLKVRLLMVCRLIENIFMSILNFKTKVRTRSFTSEKQKFSLKSFDSLNFKKKLSTNLNFLEKTLIASI